MHHQVFRMIAFGVKAFFTHFWYVSDLIIVLVSIFCETVLEVTLMPGPHLFCIDSIPSRDKLREKKTTKMCFFLFPPICVGVYL